jgi:hypothetical protein
MNLRSLIYKIIGLCLLANTLLLSMGCKENTATEVPTPSVESLLQNIHSQAEIPIHLEIIYTDMHGLWGGETLVIKGHGSLEYTKRDPDMTIDSIYKDSLAKEQILELLALLIENEAWVQYTPDRMPLTDESKAYLHINLKEHSSLTWEWYNDLKRNNRLIVIKNKMLPSSQ